MSTQEKPATATISELKEILGLVYDKPEGPSSFVAITGESGVGKTEMTAQLVNDMKHYSEYRVLNVAHLNIEDMGIPDTSEEWLKFKFSQSFMPPKEGKNVLLILDELNRVQNETISNFLMGLINERRLFGSRVPDYMHFIGTFNPNTDEYPETQDILRDLAMKRRVCVIELRFDVDQFMNYAQKKLNFDEVLFNFLRQNQDQILVPGANNCPRNWAKFDHDIMKARAWDTTEHKMMGLSSSMFMCKATLKMWVKFFEGSLEKFVNFKGMVKDWAGAKEVLADQLKRNKIDLIATTGDDIKSIIKEAAYKLTPEAEVAIKEFFLMVPKSISFSVIEDVVHNGRCADINKMLYSDKEIMKLISSGVS